MPRWQKLLRHDALIHRYKEAVRNAMAYACPRITGAGAHRDDDTPACLEQLEPRLLLSSATYTVTTDVDELDSGTTLAELSGGEGLSLREALVVAYNNIGDDIIEFSPDAYSEDGVLSLVGSGLTIDSNVEIRGPGADQLEINAGGNSGVFTVVSGVSVTIDGVTIAGGNVGLGYGGGINTLGTLDLTNSVITGNTTLSSGGGISNQGTLTLLNTEVTGNTASVYGGGIFNFGSGNVVFITDSTIDGNQGGSIGGIYQNGGSLEVTGSTISNNTSTSGGAGGMFVTTSADVAITNSTVSGNVGRYGAGGISLSSGTLEMTNVTITDNTQAISYVDAGGISIAQGTSLIANNCIIYGNFKAGTALDTTGSFNWDSANNLVGVTSGTPNLDPNKDNLVGTADPMLAPLGYYGGLTQTHALLTGSDAIDAGDSSLISETTDQRGTGYIREINGIVDIGAFEADNDLTLLVTTAVDENNVGDEFAGTGLSLREALSLSSQIDGTETISFDPSITSIVLGGTELSIVDDVNILGTGADQLTISASTTSGEESRVFSVLTGATASIDGLTITNGNVASGFGGGIDNAGDLTLSNIVVDANNAIAGAGINNTGTLSLVNSEITNNSGSAGAGGIYNYNGTLQITDSLFSGNVVPGNGGAVMNNGASGTIDITDSVFYGNTAANGSAVYSYNSGAITVTNSTAEANTGTAFYLYGTGDLTISGTAIINNNSGGIDTAYGSAVNIDIVNTTISNNDGIAFQWGGDGASSTITIVNTTITQNGGGIYSEFGNPPMLYNTIVVGNDKNNTGAYDIYRMVGGTYNLVGTTEQSNSSFDTDPTNQVGVTEAQVALSPLGDYGGPTKTHALLPGSLAIDAGDDTQAAGLTYDQRGENHPRKLGDTVDIGAYEARTQIVLLGDDTVALGDTYDLTIRLAGAYENYTGYLDLTIDWGDDPPALATIEFLDGQSVAGILTQHDYSPGLANYTITVELTDNSVTTQSMPLVVNVTDDYWFEQTGGSESDAGSATINGSYVTLQEGDSFRVSLSKTYDLDGSFDWLLLAFDYPDFVTDGNTPINDAFEIALLDADGNSLVPTIDPGRDAFFNLTAGESPLFAQGVSFVAGRLTLDVSQIADNTQATLVYRLVNNDDVMSGTSVNINMDPTQKMPVWVFDDGVIDGDTSNTFRGTPIPDSQGDGKLLLIDLDENGSLETVTNYGQIYYRRELSGGTYSTKAIPHQNGSLLEAVAIGPNGIAYFTTNQVKSTGYDPENVGAPSVDDFFRASPHLFKLDLNEVWRAEALGESWYAEHVGAISITDYGATDGGDGALMTGLSIDPSTGKLYMLGQVRNGTDSSPTDVIYELPAPVSNTVSAVKIFELQTAQYDIKHGEDMRFADIGSGSLLYIVDSTEGVTNTIYSVNLSEESNQSNLSIAQVYTSISSGVLNPDGSDAPDPVKANVEGIGFDPITGDFIISDTKYGDTNAHSVLYRLDNSNGTKTLLDLVTSQYFDPTPSGGGAASSSLIADVEGMAIVTLPSSLPGNVPVNPVGGQSDVTDFDNLTDATDAFMFDYGVTTLNQSDAVLFAALTPTLIANAGVSLRGPLLIGVTNISDPTVSLYDTDGITPEGIQFYDITSLAGPDANGFYSTPGELPTFFLKFLNPAGDTFTYDLVVLSQLNQAPVFTKEPEFTDVAERVIEIGVGNPFDFTALATDDDGDPLTYSFVTKPSGLNLVNADAYGRSPDGEVYWDTTGLSVDSHLVTMKVEDGFGGQDLMSFTIKITDANHPPYFVKPPQPVTEAYVNTYGDSNLLDPTTGWNSIAIDTTTAAAIPTWVSGTLLPIASPANPVSTIYLSGDSFDSTHLRVLMSGSPWGNPGSADSMGMVFGYQDGGHFYLIDWQAAGSVNEGLSIKRIDSDTPISENDLTAVGGNGSTVTELFHSDLVWSDTVFYVIDVIHLEGEFTVAVSQGSQVLESVTVFDDAYQSGQIGFYANDVASSQFSVIAQDIGDNPYIYTPDAFDQDQDELRFSLDAAPAGMFIDQYTGRIVWNATPDLLTDTDGVDVTIRVEDLDSNGNVRSAYSYGLQDFNVLVYKDPDNSPPVFIEFPQEDHTISGIPSLPTTNIEIVSGETDLELAPGLTSDIIVKYTRPGNPPAALNPDMPSAVANELAVFTRGRGLQTLSDSAFSQLLTDALLGAGASGIDVTSNVTSYHPVDSSGAEHSTFAMATYYGNPASSTADSLAGNVGVFRNPNNIFDLGEFGIVMSTGDAAYYATNYDTLSLPSNFTTDIEDSVWYDYAVEDNGTPASTAKPYQTALLQAASGDSGESYYDVVELRISFDVDDLSTFTGLSFDVAFGSEEFDGYVNDYNDTFGIYLNPDINDTSNELITPVNELVNVAFKTAVAPEFGHETRIEGVYGLNNIEDSADPSYIAPGTVLGAQYNPASININHPQMQLVSLANQDTPQNSFLYPDTDTSNSILEHASNPKMRFTIEGGVGSSLQEGTNTIVFILGDTNDAQLDTTVFISRFGGADPDPIDVEVVTSNPLTDPATITPASVENVLPGGDATFTTTVTGDGGAHVFDLIFKDDNGDELGRYPVTVNNGYIAFPKAIDPDGDTITYALTQEPGDAELIQDGDRVQIKWDPPDIGNYNFEISADDGHGNVTKHSWTVAVTQVGAGNTAPTLEAITAPNATVGEPYELQLVGDDVDAGDQLRYYLIDEAGYEVQLGMDLNANTGLLEWTPQNTGTFNLKARVYDSQPGGYAERTFSITVDDIAIEDAPPNLFMSDSFSLTAGETFEPDVLGVDPNGSPVTFTLIGKPDAMAFDTDSGAMIWIPTNNDVGIHELTLIATDGTLSTVRPFTITVLAANVNPVFVTQILDNSQRDLPYKFPVIAFDPDGPGVTYSMSVTPPTAGAGHTFEIDEYTGVITGQADTNGKYQLNIIIEDEDGATTPKTYDLVVTDPQPNSAPTINSGPRNEVAVGQTLEYEIDVSDDDNDPLSITISYPSGAKFDQETGILTWTPDVDDVLPPGQTHSITVTVDDGRNEANSVVSETFYVTVTGQMRNRAPVVNPFTYYSAVVGQAYKIDPFTATDLDGDGYRWEVLEKSNPLMFIDPQSGLLTWTPDESDLGVATIVFRAVDDLEEPSEPVTLTIPVNALNGAPSLENFSPPLITGTEAIDYSYQVIAKDLDNGPDALIYTLTLSDGNPVDWLQIDSTGYISVASGETAPATEQDVNLLLTVSDGAGSVEAPFTISVVDDPTAVNEPPKFRPVPVYDAYLGQTDWTYTADVYDEEGDTPSVSILPGTDFDSFTVTQNGNTFTWDTSGLDPSYADHTYELVLEAKEDPDSGLSREWRVSVYLRSVTSNSAPIFSGTIDPVTKSPGELLTQPVRATDPDTSNKYLIYELVNTASLPEGLDIDPYWGVISWQVPMDYLDNPSNPTSFNVQIQVRDDFGVPAAVAQEFTVNIQADTELPVGKLSASNNFIEIGQDVRFFVIATDNVGVADTQLYVTNLTTGHKQLVLLQDDPSQPGRLIGDLTLETAGVYEAQLTVFDVNGLSVNDTVQVTAYDPDSVDLPTVTLTADDTLFQDGNVITTGASFSYEVNANDGSPSTLTYQLLLLDSTGFVMELDAGVGETAAPVSVDIPVTAVPNGSYTLLLTATNGNLNPVTDSHYFTIDTGSLKIGNFSISFTDMTVSTGGIPITIQRTYDTNLVDRNQDDFGIGWSLALSDTGMTTTNTIPPVGIQNDTDVSDFGKYDYFVPRTSGQTGTIIAFTLPNGDREIFEFVPYEYDQNFVDTLYYPEFEARNGTTSRLTVTDDPILVMRSGFLVGSSNYRRYSPANFNDNYILTTTDGTRYEINSVTGDITKIMDRLGNTIEYKNEGVTSKNADGDTTAQITFERNGLHGEITKIIDQNGGSVSYEYTTDGRLISFTDRTGKKTIYKYGEDGEGVGAFDVPDKYLTSVHSEYIDNNEVKHEVLLLKAKFEENSDGIIEFVGLEDAGGNAADFVYIRDNMSSYGLPTSYTIEVVNDANGVPTEIVRDANGNMVRQITRLEDRSSDNQESVYQVTIYTYDGSFNLTGQTKPFNVDEEVAGQYSRYTSLPDGVSVIDADPDSVDFDASIWQSVSTYDLLGNVTLRIDGEGNETIYGEYDQFGNPKTVTRPDGSTTNSDYDSKTGQLRTSTVKGLNADGKFVTLSITTYNYDGNGNLKNVIQKDEHGNEIEGASFTYVKGQLTKTTDTNGNERHFRYDDNGNQILSFYNTQGKLSVSWTIYDAEGRVTGTKQYIRQATTPTLDLNTILQSDVATEIEYELLTTLGADLLSSSTTTYDYAGRVDSSTSAYGLTSTNRYDARGNLVESRTPILLSNGTTVVSMVSRSFYDDNGRLVASMAPFLFDDNDNFIDPSDETIAGTTPPSFLRVTHTLYDDLGRVVETRQLKGVQISILPDAELPQYEATFGLDYAGSAIISASLTTYNDQGQVDATYQLSDIDGNGSFAAAVDDSDPTTDPGEVFINPDDVTSNFSVNEVVKTTYLYDNAGRQESSTVHIDLNQDDTIDASEQLTSTSTFDAVGHQKTSSGPVGPTTYYKYDGLGRVVQTTIDDGVAGTTNPSVKTIYDNFDRRIAEIDALGRRTDYEYDDQGRLAAVTLPEIDPDGLLGTADHTRPRYEYHYDEYGNQTAIVNNILLSADGKTVTYYGKDANDDNQVITSRNITQLAVTPDILLAASYTTLVTTFTYDQFGRQITRTLPEGQIERMFYDDTAIATVQLGSTPELSVGAGQLAFSVDFEGRVTEYLYNNTTHGGGRLVKENYYGVINGAAAMDLATLSSTLNSLTPTEHVTYTYDALGRQKQIDDWFDSANHITIYHYDTDGQLTAIDRTNATDQMTVNYEYDSLGRLTRTYTAQTVGGTAITDTSYEYDALGRMIKVTAEKRGGVDLGVAGPGGEETRYFYDELGRIDYQVFANGLTEDMIYDAFGRLDKIVHFKDTIDGDGEHDIGEDLIADFDYSYDDAGNRDSATERFDSNGDGELDDQTAQTFNWTYDGLNRLIKEVFTDGTNGYTDKFTFDLASNRATYVRETVTGSFIEFTTTYTYDANDRLITENQDVGSDSVANDTNDRITEYTYNGTEQETKSVTDGAGTDISGATYTFNVRGRMSKVDLDTDGDDTTIETTITYKYDANGIRVEQEVTTDPGEATESTKTTTYTIDPNNPTGYAQVLEERESLNSATATLATAYTLGLDVIAQTTDFSGTPKHLQFLYDAHGSTRALMEGGTFAANDVLNTPANPNDDVIQAFTYDAYGNMLNTVFGADTQAHALTILLYSGEFTNRVTGLQYLRTRYYDPTSGRFNSADTFFGIQQYPLSLHKYLYVSGNPQNQVDPSGESDILNRIRTFFLSHGYKSASTISPEAILASASISYLTPDLIMGVLVDQVLNFFMSGSAFRYNFPLPFPPVGPMTWSLSVGVEVVGRYGIQTDSFDGRVRIFGDLGLHVGGSKGIIKGQAPPLKNFLRPISIKRLKKALQTLDLRKVSESFRVPWIKGPSGGPDQRGVTFEGCVTSSIGLATWAVGGRACWNFVTGESHFEAGTGIGQGTGIAAGVAAVIVFP